MRCPPAGLAATQGVLTVQNRLKISGPSGRFVVSANGGVTTLRWLRRNRLWRLMGILLLGAMSAHAGVTITISPSPVNLPPAGTQQFTAVVTGSSDTAASWVVLEGASGGSVTAAGAYTAPSGVGLYHVVATSHADATQTATATVVVPGFMAPFGLRTARGLATATLLADGTILFAGGIDSAPLASAEIYTPSTDTSSPVQDMSTGRDGHTATLLPNGKVLIAGGQTPANLHNATAELYDPNSGSFTPTGSMSAPRSNHTATLLPNGKVLIAGGGDCTSGCVSFNSAELYDPAAGTFSPTGTMTAQRSGHTATLLTNGKVLLVGGGGPGTTSNSSAEIYDPASGAFTATGSMSASRTFFTATLLAGGKVLIAGGITGSGASSALTSSAETYDPSVGMFSPTGSLNGPRYDHTATLLQNGQVLIACGSVTQGLATQAELYDPTTGNFKTAGALHEPRIWHTATLLATGKVVIAAGTNIAVGLASTEIFDPAAGTFTTNSLFLNVERQFHTATSLPDGTILYVGGYDNPGDVSASAEIYNPSTKQFTLTGSLATARYGHTATLLNNGKVLVVGGFSSISSPTLLSSAEVFDPSTGKFSAAGNTTVARAKHAAALLPNGNVLIAGGEDPATANSLQPAALASAEIYDPVAGTFTATANMDVPRYWHTATLLNTGKVLVAGGVITVPAQIIPALGDLYDPIVQTFANVGNENQTGGPIGGSTPFESVLLEDGRVLIGIDALFDPASNGFSLVPSASLVYVNDAARTDFTSTLLPTGQVLVAGGQMGRILGDAYLFDPSSEIYSSAGNMQYARLDHTSTLLSNGLVLVAGGGAFEAELYQPPASAPTPTVTGVSPSPFTGFASFQFTVQGSNFLSNAAIRLDGQSLQTTFNSSVQLTATVPTQALITPGVHTVTVANFQGVASAPFSVTVSNPILQPSPANGSTLTYPSTSLDVSSTPQFVTLQNTGNAPLTIDSIVLSGTNSADFVFDAAHTNCSMPGGTVGPLNSCLLSIVFIPHADGTSNATLTVTYESLGSPYQIALTGTGVGQTGVSITPPSLGFGNQPIGTSSASQTLTLTNLGGAAVNPGVTLTDTTNFSMNNQCTGTLAASASCSIMVTFSPTTSGALNAAVVITGIGANGPTPALLTGMGTNFSLSPAAGSSGSAAVTAGQTASYQLSLSPASFTGSVTLTCTGIPAGATCTVSPSPAVLNAPNATNVTVNVTTTAKSEIAAPRLRIFVLPGSPSFGLALSLYMAALSVLVAAAYKRRKALRWTLATTVLSVLALCSCGGGGMSQGGNPNPSAGTPPGTYQFTVTASATGISRNITLTLKVQ